MECKIQQHIIEYFTYFEEFYNSTKSCLKDCQKCAVAINKLIKRCNDILEVDIRRTPLAEFEDLQSRISSSIHNLISNNIKEIQSKYGIIEETFEKLCHKHKLLTKSCKEVDVTQATSLVRGTPLQPPLKVILQFAEDTISFGSQICAQIDTSLSVLALKGLKTESQVENFKVSSTWQDRVKEIIAYTSFSAENIIYYGST